MKYKYLGLSFFLAFFLLGRRMADAQSRGLTVSGIVSNPSNVPLVGVSIRIQNTQSGTITNTSGSYELDVPELGDTLVFSYLGYESQKVAVGSNSLNVTLYPS